MRRWLRASAAGAVVVMLFVTVRGEAYGRSGPPRALFDVPLTHLLPGRSPSGLCLESIVETDPEDARNGTDRVAAYGAGDPMTGRMVAAIYHGGNEYDGVPGDAATAGSGRSGREGRWLAWGIPGKQDGSYYAVVGRGLSARELRTAANSVAGGPTDVRIGPDGVPKGLRPLGSVPLPLGPNWDDLRPAGATLTWKDQRRGRELSLTLVHADRWVAGLVGAFIAGRPRLIRGVPGLAGRPLPDSAPPRRFRVWRERGTVGVVSATGLSDAEADAFVADLRPADPQRLEGERSAIVRHPCTPLLDHGTHQVTGGRTDTVAWAVGVTRQGGRIQARLREVTARGPATEGGGFDPVQESLKLRVVFGRYGYPWGRVLAGVTAPGVTRVRLERADGSSVDLRLGAPTIPDGFRWFSAYEKEGVGATVVAYDGTGNIVQRWRID